MELPKKLMKWAQLQRTHLFLMQSKNVFNVCLVTQGSLNKETNQDKESWEEILIFHYNTLDETCYLLVLLFNIVI